MSERVPGLLLALLIAAAGAGLLLLVCDAVLIGRVLRDEARHVARGTIHYAYALALFCLAGAPLLLSRLGEARLMHLRRVIAALCICAAAAWLIVHGGGFIYSHESMFEGR